MAWVLEHSEATYADRLVLIAIANHAGPTGWSWPAVPQIAREAGVDRATVFRAITMLEESGELTIRRRPGRASVYGLTAVLKGSQIATGEGVANCDGGVASARQRGRRLRPEPSVTITEPSRARAREAETPNRIAFPARCAACDTLEFDCLCDRAPLIQGVGR